MHLWNGHSQMLYYCALTLWSYYLLMTSSSQSFLIDTHQEVCRVWSIVQPPSMNFPTWLCAGCFWCFVCRYFIFRILITGGHGKTALCATWLPVSLYLLCRLCLYLCVCLCYCCGDCEWTFIHSFTNPASPKTKLLWQKLLFFLKFAISNINYLIY